MRLHTGESLLKATPDWTWKERAALGQRYLRDLAESLLNARYSDSEFETYGDRKKKAVEMMQRQLETDGYVFKNGVLLVPEESVLDDDTEQGVLANLVIEVGLQDHQTILHHLSLSADHYREGRWDDSISNSRKVLEAVLSQTACAYTEQHSDRGNIPTPALERPVKVRDYLEEIGLLDKKEKQTISSVYGLLSEKGAHPHIAHQDQARLLRHLALTLCQFVLLRFRGVLKSAS